MAKVTGIGGVFFKSKGDPAAWPRADGNKVELWQPRIWNEKNKAEG